MTLTIDLHHHVIPEFYWDATNEDGNVAGGINPPRWILDGRSPTSTKPESTWQSRRSAPHLQLITSYVNDP